MELENNTNSAFCQSFVISTGTIKFFIPINPTFLLIKLLRDYFGGNESRMISVETIFCDFQIPTIHLNFFTKFISKISQIKGN